MSKNFFLLFISTLIIHSCERKGRNRDYRNVVTKTSMANQGTKPNESLTPNINTTRPSRKKSESITKVKMTASGGVYEVPIQINSQPMNFIFDTGASSISISVTEARYLYKNGYLTDDDFIGNVQFIDATGDISTGMRIKLNEVKIGNRVLNDVTASIVNNINAPLLLGQSALSQFGKVTIDYNNQQLIIE